MLSHIHLMPQHDPGHCISEHPTWEISLQRLVTSCETTGRRDCEGGDSAAIYLSLGGNCELRTGHWELETIDFTRNLKTCDESIYLKDLRQPSHLRVRDAMQFNSIQFNTHWARPNYALRIKVTSLGRHSFCPRGSGTSMGPCP
ncbi:uncharacterized protein Bfra_005401 [Botrytis fragariae]|uniref:Uncharacterized protein n=1 Tax=Botrytis fragariae TaxID=1964551 RepID=A0A8H6AUX1_9HELO|nr:uncharacterized protein Bfra_005401 [Botrytis fragariae]KAF5873934.1 hypothetical protein Bfra_005401 [Botrytis fragariae]